MALDVPGTYVQSVASRSTRLAVATFLITLLFLFMGLFSSARPKRLGGVAGGKKYLWRGILFKLADGSQGPYGGSDEAAAKAAGHELRSASKTHAATVVLLRQPPYMFL